MEYISIMIVPMFVLMILISGLLNKVSLFDTFIEGAKTGIETTFKILPSLVGLLVAVSVFRTSGTLDIITSFLSPFLDYFKFPKEVLPLALMRPISGSGALAIVKDIYQTHGVDSFIGKVASVMMGSTETTFYTLAIYFGSINIKNTKYTVKSALIADLAGVVLSVILVYTLLN